MRVREIEEDGYYALYHRRYARAADGERLELSPEVHRVKVEEVGVPVGDKPRSGVRVRLCGFEGGGWVEEEPRVVAACDLEHSWEEELRLRAAQREQELAEQQYTVTRDEMLELLRDHARDPQKAIAAICTRMGIMPKDFDPIAAAVADGSMKVTRLSPEEMAARFGKSPAGARA